MFGSFSLPFFWRWSRRLKPLFGLVSLCLLGLGVWLGLFVSPQDYQHGDAVRIMYVHVPASWMALGIYSFMAAASLAGFVWRAPMGLLAARAAAPLGLVLTFVSLVTGSLWGKPMWGAWWVWDARLTSVLLLFFLYLGYVALVEAYTDPTKGERMGAILALIGFINIPIIKFSVTWWQTLHQEASVMRLSGPSIHPDMLTPLLVMGAAYAFGFGALVLVRMESLLMARKVRVLEGLRTSLAYARGEAQ